MIDLNAWKPERVSVHGIVSPDGKQAFRVIVETINIPVPTWEEDPYYHTLTHTAFMSIVERLGWCAETPKE